MHDTRSSPVAANGFFLADEAGRGGLGRPELVPPPASPALSPPATFLSTALPAARGGSNAQLLPSIAGPEAVVGALRWLCHWSDSYACAPPAPLAGRDVLLCVRVTFALSAAPLERGVDVRAVATLVLLLLLLGRLLLLLPGRLLLLLLGLLLQKPASLPGTSGGRTSIADESGITDDPSLDLRIASNEPGVVGRCAYAFTPPTALKGGCARIDILDPSVQHKPGLQKLIVRLYAKWVLLSTHEHIT